ncbi:MAG: homoserine O-succinyltransferase [Spirochaetaceae bacterium]|jgi:homoserine O-succinyltransferase|nr:homoserine O-succinyltransferase [Spirochaetaceae bacterium]
MPINIPQDLPAFRELIQENVFVMAAERAGKQDIRPMKVAIVNLMPTTITTEIQLLRLLGNTPLQVDITLLRMDSHEAHNAPPGHLEKFYSNLGKIKKEAFDGLIITGAPVETLPFAEVDYWDELCELFEYSKKHVWSTLHICWGAQAGLYYNYGVPKIQLPGKLFGIFSHNVNEKHTPLFRGFDDIFLAPQSRHTESDRDAINANNKLLVQSQTPCGSPFIVTALNCREIYINGHLEYDALTLDAEYRRDKAKGIDIKPPRNYYRNDDPNQMPIVRWRAHAHLFFSNWLNYVYQETPFDIRELA